MSRGVIPAKAGWAPVVAVGAGAMPPRSPDGALDETRAMPRELLLARARRLAWRAPTVQGASTASDPREASASAEPSASVSDAPSSDTAPSAGQSPRADAPSASAIARLLRARSRRAADGYRWLLGVRRRHSRAAGALVGVSLVLVIVSLGSSAPGDAGNDTDRVEARAFAPAGLSAASAEPSTRASDPTATADAVVDAALERRAADAIAEGRHADAARLHARLAELHPERPVFRAAARILGESARELAATDPGNVVWAGRGGPVR